MKNSVINVILLFVVLLGFSYSYAQDPPPMAMPKGANKVLVHDIISVSNYDKFLKEYVFSKIEIVAREKKWTPEYKTKIQNSVSLDDFRTTLENALAFASKEDLQLLKTALETFNQHDKDGIVFINAMILNNLEGFSKNVIEGQYLYKNLRKK